MASPKTICIISNSHSTNDVRLYHKLGKSLAKIASVYVLGARGTGSRMEDYQGADTDAADPDPIKPTRIIASGFTPFLRLFGLYRQALQLKPDLVICVEPLTMLVGVRLKSKTRCKLCYDAHEYYSSAHGERYGFPFNYILGGLYYLFEHTLQEQMDLTIAVNDDIFRLFNLKFPETVQAESPESRTLVRKYLTPPHLGVICPNYPTSAVFKEDPAACGISRILPDTLFDTIYLGGLTEERGIIKLLQVVDLLRAKHPQLKALFVGPFHTEAFKQKFFTYLMDHNLNANVFWRDVVPHDKVCAILRQVRVGLSVLHPGYKRYKKGISLKVLEYLAVGIPVVANDFPQIKDIITKHDLGICVPFHRQDIADAIDKLLSLPATELEAMGTRSREIVRKHYLWTRVEPVLLDAINFVLADSRN